MAYTTQTLIENYLDRSLNSNEVALLGILVPQIDKYIDMKTGSHFDSVEETTRKYDGQGEQEVDIDPCQAVTDVTVGSTVDSDKYVLEPINETVKRSLRLIYGSWNSGVGNIEVTAKFSEYDFDNDNVPEDIQMIATRLVGTLINQSGDAAGIKSERLEGHSIEYDTGSTANDVDSLARSDAVVKSILDMRTNIQVG